MCSSDLVAALAEVAYEEPGVARGLVIAPPTNWNPDTATVGRLLDALRGFPLVEPVTLSGFFDRVSTEGDDRDAVRTLAPGDPPPPSVTPEEYDFAAERLRSYAAVVGADDPSTADAERALHTALASDIDAERARAELDRVERTEIGRAHV